MLNNCAAILSNKIKYKTDRLAQYLHQSRNRLSHCSVLLFLFTEQISGGKGHRVKLCVSALSICKCNVRQYSKNKQTDRPIKIRYLYYII